MNKGLKIIYSVSFLLLVSSILIIPLILASPALTDNIVSYYKFDEQDTTGSGTIYDELYTQNGTNVGTTNTTGKIVYAYDFDGDNDYIRIPSTTFNNNFTISFWMELDVIEAAIPAGESFIFEWLLYATGEMRFYIGGGDGTWGTPVTAGAGSILADTEYFIVGVYNTTHTNYYINNVSVGWVANTKDPGSSAFGIGARDLVAGFFIDGMMDEFAIWGRALSEAEITELYNNGDGLQYPFVVDTCTCPGLNQDWEIDHSDYCNITEACDLGTGTLSFTGAGYCNCNASVDTTNLGDPGATGILYIQDSCLITID